MYTYSIFAQLIRDMSAPANEFEKLFHEWPRIASEIAHAAAHPSSMLATGSHVSTSSHCSGLDTQGWALKLVERFSRMRFENRFACEKAGNI